MRCFVRADSGRIGINAGDDELCVSCGNQANCPLIQLLFAEKIVLRCGEIKINNCGLYVPVAIDIPEYTRYGEGGKL